MVVVGIDGCGLYKMVVVGTGVLSKGDRLAVLLMASHLLLLPNPHCHKLESWREKKCIQKVYIEAKIMI